LALPSPSVSPVISVLVQLFAVRQVALAMVPVQTVSPSSSASR